MQFRLLGPVEIDNAGQPVPLPRRRERCLLAILVLSPNRAVPMDRLVDLLWDGEPPERARRIVHSHISRLRAAIANGDGVAIDSVGDGYRINLDSESVDAHQFQDLLAQASATTDAVERIATLRRALDLWGGRPLDNAATDLQRGRLCSPLEELRLTATQDLLAASLDLRLERDVLPELAQLASTHPGHEGIIELHMRALHQAGRKADALEAFQRARQHLADELGLDPSPRLRRQHQAILRDEPDLVAAPRTDGTGVKPPRLAPAAPERVTPRQLPADVAGFTGRTSELEQLDALLPEAGSAPAAVVITAIGGAAGIGKSSLAIHWAHRVEDHFPDGQLYVNLRGYDPGEPMAAAEAVRTLLEMLQVRPERVPASLDAQVALYRSLLAGRRMLVLLDNARDAEQAQPLLPGTPGCLAVVTSRNRLTGMVAAKAVTPITLDLPSASEGRQLLARRLGTERVSAEPDAAGEIVTRCARLPLALALVAARAATYPDFRLAAIAKQLRDIDGSPTPLATSDRTIDVRMVFSWSYQTLSNEAARLFRLLGLHPGPDVTVPAGASLAGYPLPQAHQLFTELADIHLLTEHAPGRYTFHDLLRAYATHLTDTVDTAEQRQTARHRMLDFYLQASHAAARLIDPHSGGRLKLTPPMPGVVIHTGLRDPRGATSWFLAERPVLVRVIEQAALYGFDTHTWQLATRLPDLFDRLGHWHDHVTVQETALQAVTRVGDAYAQSRIHAHLGNAYASVERFKDAREQYQHSLDLSSAANDQLSEAYDHLNLFWLSMRQGAFHEALNHGERALDLFRTVGDRAGQGRALNVIGWAYANLGEHREALARCEEALAINDAVGDEAAAANTWDSLGYCYHQLGDQPKAITCYQRSLSLFDRQDNLQNRAETLDRLGDAYCAAQEIDAARAAWWAALELFDQLGDPAAAEVRTKLAGPLG